MNNDLYKSMVSVSTTLTPLVLDGKLLPFETHELENILLETLNETTYAKDIVMAEVNTNLGESLIALNDLFVGPKSHTSARYGIAIGEQYEEQSSSGVIISTGLGSTGWFKSILVGAAGVSHHPISSALKHGFSWDSKFLYYTVREPFPSATTGCEIVFGKITESASLTMTSKMPENGVIFSDGIEQDAIDLNAGVIASIAVSSRVGNLITGH